MSAVGDEEDKVFLDCGASPELCRSTRTSARKRSSNGGLLSAKPKKREKKIIDKVSNTRQGGGYTQNSRLNGRRPIVGQHASYAQRNVGQVE